MSTRATVHFIHGAERVIIYVHHDGYPKGRGKDLLRFLDRLRTLKDGTRLGQVDVVAARFVAFMFEEYQRDLSVYDSSRDPLETPSIRILDGDPGDIAFRYTVDCAHGGKVTYESTRWRKDDVVFVDEGEVTPELVGLA